MRRDLWGPLFLCLILAILLSIDESAIGEHDRPAWVFSIMLLVSKCNKKSLAYVQRWWMRVLGAERGKRESDREGFWTRVKARVRGFVCGIKRNSLRCVEV